MATSRLAGAIDGVIGVDPHRDTWPRPLPTRWVACSRRPRSGQMGPAIVACSPSPGRRCLGGVG
jgi:hypothetical protein